MFSPDTNMIILHGFEPSSIMKQQQNGRHFEDGIFEFNFMDEYCIDAREIC